MTHTKKTTPPVPAQVISPDGSIRRVTPVDGVSFSLAELQDLVGGLIEIVDVPDEDHVLVVNEDGKLKGLPYNALASRLVELWPDDYIVGPAVFCLASQVR